MDECTDATAAYTAVRPSHAISAPPGASTQARRRRWLEHDGENAPQWKAELGHRIAFDQISHRVGMHEDARDVAAGLLCGACRCGLGASWPRRSVISAGQPHRGELAIIEIQGGAEQHDLAVEGAAEEVAVSLLDAGSQVGERESRSVAAQSSKIERQCIRHRARNCITGQFGRSGRCNLGLSTERARGELDRHRGDRLPSMEKLSGIRRITSSVSVWTLSERTAFFTANRCAG